MTSASAFATWRARGWRALTGRDPGPDDLLLPLPPAHVARRRKVKGDEHRDSDYSYKRWQADLAMLELRPRRGHDARATFVTLALDDGADPGVVERLTHPPKARSAFNLYNRGQQWNIACREVATLNVGRSLLDGAAPQLGAPLGAVESVSVEKVSASGGTRTLRAQIVITNRFAILQ